MSRALPDSVQQIADVIGEELALELVRRLPRQHARPEHPAGEPVLYVPKTVTPEHRLARIVGFDAARKLSRIFGGDLLFLATCASRRKTARNSDIVAASKNATPAVVADRFSISERQVRRILAAARADTPPMVAAASRGDSPAQFHGIAAAA